MSAAHDRRVESCRCRQRLSECGRRVDASLLPLETKGHGSVERASKGTTTPRRVCAKGHGNIVCHVLGKSLEDLKGGEQPRGAKGHSGGDAVVGFDEAAVKLGDRSQRVNSARGLGRRTSAPAPQYDQGLQPQTEASKLLVRGGGERALALLNLW
jgi:hypothetical protein